MLQLTIAHRRLLTNRSRRYGITSSSNYAAVLSLGYSVPKFTKKTVIGIRVCFKLWGSFTFNCFISSDISVIAEGENISLTDDT